MSLGILLLRVLLERITRTTSRLCMCCCTSLFFCVYVRVVRALCVCTCTRVYERLREHGHMRVCACVSDVVCACPFVQPSGGFSSYEFGAVTFGDQTTGTGSSVISFWMPAFKLLCYFLKAFLTFEID